MKHYSAAAPTLREGGREEGREGGREGGRENGGENQTSTMTTCVDYGIVLNSII